jgi:hypothetical protein
MYIHEPADSIKGQMWPDIGLGDWYFEVDRTTPEQVAARVLEVPARPDAAKRKVGSGDVRTKAPGPKDGNGTRIVIFARCCPSVGNFPPPLTLTRMQQRATDSAFSNSQ